MSEIELKRANVVKRVDSEDKAKALEAKGFVRTDGTVANKTESNAASEAVINELKEQLLKAGKVIEASDARRGELEKELTSTKEKLRRLLNTQKKLIKRSLLWKLNFLARRNSWRLL